MILAGPGTMHPKRRRRSCVDRALACVGLMVGFLSVGCSRVDGPAEEVWPTLGIPQGAPLIQWDALRDLSERTEIKVEPEQTYRTPDGWLTGGSSILHVVVLEDRLLVLSGSRGQFAEFGSDGGLARLWAGMGTESGELLGPIGMAVNGGEVYVIDVAVQRISRWNSARELVDEVSDEEFAQVNHVAGASHHGLVVNKVLLTMDDEQQALSLYSFDGREKERYAILPTDINQEEQTIWPRPLVSVGADGAVYATTGAAYLIHAFAPDGTIRWVLQVEWDRLPVTEATRRTVERTRRAGRALGANVRDRQHLPEIPSTLPALESIEVDGRDRLFVFPLVDAGADRYPVDVYSHQGERLASGWLPFQNWEAQSGDHIYRIETDPETDETIVVRYRIDLRSE